MCTGVVPLKGKRSPNQAGGEQLHPWKGFRVIFTSESEGQDLEINCQFGAVAAVIDVILDPGDK